MKRNLLISSIMVLFWMASTNAGDNILSDLAILESSIDAIDTQLKSDTGAACSRLTVVDSKIDRDDRTILTLQSIVDRVSSKLDILSSKETVIDTTLISESSKVSVAINFLADASGDLSRVDLITSKMDRTAIAINSKLDVFFAGPFFITQSDVVGGFLTLSASGEYRLATDITATVTITAPNVSLDLDNHTIMTDSSGAGRSVVDIGLNGDNAHICNGQIIAIAPTTNAQALIPAIKIAGDRVELNSLVITCNNTTAVVSSNGQNGRAAINNQGINTEINSCHIVAGSGANTTVISGAGGAGGIGISNNVSQLSLDKSVVRGGAGGNSTDQSSSVGGAGGRGIDSLSGDFLQIVSSEIFGAAGGSSFGSGGSDTGGVGGIGIFYSGNDACFIDSIILGGNGGTSASAAQGAIGANALQSSGSNVQRVVIDHCTIQGGDGGAGVTGSDNYGSDGGNGVLNVVSDATITDCLIVAGVGGRGGDSGSSTAGNAGNGGIGISHQALQGVIQGCTIVGGNGGNGGNASNPIRGGDGGAGGNGVTSSGNNLTVITCNVTAGAGGNGGSSTGAGNPGDGGVGGTGISNTVFGLSVSYTDIIGGNGGSAGTTSGSGNGTGSTAGSGILNQGASLFCINNCTIRAGSALDLGFNSGGGAGGHGIDNVTTVTGEILDCIIISGFGSSSVTSTAAGAGGNGINIRTGCNSIVVEGCLISTGAGGNGGATGGAGGSGISVSGGTAPDNIAIRRCGIQGTGRGGNGTAGGAGGNGILLSTGNNTEVSNCVLSDTGIAGTGGAPIAGQAIRQLVASTNAVFFSNFAYNIANATPYSMAGTTVNATDATAGSAIATSTRILDNVHAP